MNASLEAQVHPRELLSNLFWMMYHGYVITFHLQFNTGLMLDNALKLGENVILEGAQGCLLDIDQGTFPYVTSSVTSRGNSTHGAEFIQVMSKK